VFLWNGRRGIDTAMFIEKLQTAFDPFFESSSYPPQVWSRIEQSPLFHRDAPQVTNHKLIVENDRPRHIAVSCRAYTGHNGPVKPEAFQGAASKTVREKVSKGGKPSRNPTILSTFVLLFSSQE
jgi:hypothetical protein